LGLAQDLKLGVGVDRLDYTKGILERFMAIERLLELEPRWVGQFAFIHVAAQVYELYRAAELCYVSSLHDGMNLVAKEFVAARDDEQGVLILSQFTGAARELS